LRLFEEIGGNIQVKEKEKEKERKEKTGKQKSTLRAFALRAKKEFTHCFSK
jgi:hypothetical protein